MIIYVRYLYRQLFIVTCAKKLKATSVLIPWNTKNHLKQQGKVQFPTQVKKLPFWYLLFHNLSCIQGCLIVSELSYQLGV